MKPTKNRHEENATEHKAKAAAAYLVWIASASEKAVGGVAQIKKIITKLFSLKVFTIFFSYFITAKWKKKNYQTVQSMNSDLGSIFALLPQTKVHRNPPRDPRKSVIIAHK